MPTCPYAQAPYPVAPGPYTVVVGGGGGYARENPGIPSAQQYASQGSNSELYPTPGGSGSGIVASGGGAGQAREFSPGPVQQGGSGGGRDTYSPSHPQYTGTTVASPDGRSPTVQGYPGTQVQLLEAAEAALVKQSSPPWHWSWWRRITNFYRRSSWNTCSFSYIRC